MENLISQGYDVVIIDNLATGKKDNIHLKAIFSYNKDIGNTERLDEIFAEVKPAIVNHHTAQVDLRRSAGIPYMTHR